MFCFVLCHRANSNVLFCSLPQGSTSAHLKARPKALTMTHLPLTSPHTLPPPPAWAMHYPSQAIPPLTKLVMTAQNKLTQGQHMRHLGLGAMVTPAVMVKVAAALVTGRVGMGKVARMGNKRGMSRAPLEPITAIDTPLHLHHPNLPHQGRVTAERERVVLIGGLEREDGS